MIDTYIHTFIYRKNLVDVDSHTHTYIYIYIYIYIERERGGELKNKVIQKEEFNIKESQRYNVLVQMNHYQNSKGC